MYRHLGVDTTFKQTESVLSMLQKLPGPKSIQNMTPYFNRYVIYLLVRVPLTASYSTVKKEYACASFRYVQYLLHELDCHILTD